MKNHNGVVLIISGPSSVGKSKVITKIIESDIRYIKAISCTSRTRRVEEKEGEDYYFISEQEFHRRIKASEFLQWKKSKYGYYGTPLASLQLEIGQICIVDADPDSYYVFKAMGYEVISIYLLPNSLETIKKRLYSRGPDRGIKTSEDARLRFNSSVESIKSCYTYDYLIVNDDETTTTDTITRIVDTEILKLEKDNLYKKWFSLIQNYYTEEGEDGKLIV
ncbi:guanylate kinase [Paenibacillus agilis]|nr:hypothetical protein [Paenibacillus agilis]